MSVATLSVNDALDEFVDHYTKSAEWLHTDHDPEWASACEIGAPYRSEGGEERIRWQPTLRDHADDFRGLEAALETPIHPDVQAYFGRYWAASMAAAAPDGPVSLIFLWNEDDIARLTENLIGHALAQRRARAPFSIFFATTTESSDYFLAVRNDTGEVQLELPGRKAVRTVAPNLATFLEELSPAPPPV